MNDSHAADDRVLIVLVTVPDAASGQAIQRAAVEARLAACVSRIPGVHSLFRWQGEVDRAEEELLLLKTRAGRWEELRRLVQSVHPYEVPEILAMPVEDGLSGYLQWVRDETA